MLRTLTTTALSAALALGLAACGDDGVAASASGTTGDDTTGTSSASSTTDSTTNSTNSTTAGGCECDANAT